MTQHQHGNGDVHRASPDPVEQRDRELGRAEFRDTERRADVYPSSHREDEHRLHRHTDEAAFAGHDDRDPEEIEREIERTRADMDVTLDALQRKLSPGQLMDQALDYLRSGPGGFASNFGTRVRDNPLPIALTAVGIGWLMFAGDREERVRTRHVTRYHYDDEYDDADRYAATSGRSGLSGGEGRYGAGYGSTGTAATTSPGTYTAPGSNSTNSTQEAYEEGRWKRAKHRAADTRDRASGMAHDARDRLGSVGESARERMHDMRDRASDAMHRTSDAMRGAGHRAGDVSHAARRSAARTRDGFSYMVDEHPFTLGVVGVALGACLGAMLPSTRSESEWMGETRDDFIDRAKEYGRDEAERMRRVAKSAASAAQHAAEDEADRQGLSGEKDMAKDAADSAKSAVGAKAEAKADKKQSTRTTAKPDQDSAPSPRQNTTGGGI